jgi:hypothetical protein
MEAMDKEMTNPESHNVYELVPRASGTRTLRLGWVHQKFKNSIFEKNKAMLVVRGNHQRHGIRLAVQESFSPVMRLESPRTLLTIATIRDLDITQFDITSSYFHCTPKKGIYVEQPDGYIAPGKENWVWRLKGLYGRAQARRTWNEELSSPMESEGFAAMPKKNVPGIFISIPG